jgi:DNA-binding transcriptional MerR regulator
MATLTGLIREKDLARELGLTVWALRAWRKRGYGPPAGKVGRTVVYRRSDVDDFLVEVTEVRS